MSQIKLTYDCAIGLQDPVAMTAQVGAASCYDNGELELLMMQVASDTTNIVLGGVQREIILDVLPSGEELFPTDVNKKDATREIFSQSIAVGGLVRVTAADPVVIP